MANCESNRNDWKDGNSKCNCYDKKDSYNCEPKDDKHEHDKKETCCCKDSMRKALELLSCPTINPYVIFNNFGFIGDSFSVGTTLNVILINGDNLSSPNSTFNGFESCNCSSIKLSPTNTVIYAPGPPLGLIINHISLCDIESIVFRIDTTNITRSEFEANLIQLLDDCPEKCFIKCDECCCNEDVFNSIYSSFSSSVISLTAGGLTLENAKVLGRVGNVLVLSKTSTPANLIYFVCLDSIGFLNY